MIKTNRWYDRKRFASFLNCTVATHFKNQSTESTDAGFFFFGLLWHIGSIAQISLMVIHISIRQISSFAGVFKYYYPYRTCVFTQKPIKIICSTICENSLPTSR